MTSQADKARYGGGSVTKYTYRNKTRTVTKWRYQLHVTGLDSAKKLQGKSGFTTKKDAQAALRDAIKRLEEGKPMHSSKKTLGAYTGEWIESRRLAASTLAGYRKIIRNHIDPHLGHYQITAITPTILNAFYKELQERGRKDKQTGAPLSANSVNKVHALLSQILESAYGDDLVHENVAKKPTVNPPRAKEIAAQKEEITVWSPAELTSFLQWDKESFGDDLYTLWLVYARTGLRRSEALALKWSDFNATQQTLAIRRAADSARAGATKPTKSGKARVLDLPQDVTATLKKWKSVRAQMAFEFGQADAFIFGNNTGGLRSPNEIGRRWTYRVKSAQESLPELPRITLHDLRHTHATHLLAAGVHPKVVQERLGHSTISITLDLYSHLMPTTQRESVRQLEALYS